MIIVAKCTVSTLAYGDVSFTATKSHCNGFYSHNANAPKIFPSVEQKNAPATLFLAFHVATGCYTLNLWLAFFCGQLLMFCPK